MATPEVTLPAGFELDQPAASSLPAGFALDEPPKAPQSAASFAKEMVSNIPDSASRLAGSVMAAVRHPVDTALGVWDAAAGGLHNLLPQSVTQPVDTALPSSATERAVQAANAVGDFYKKRYGSVDNTVATIKTDPVGVAADLSSIFGVAGKMAKIAGLGKTARTFSTLSKATDPLYLTVKGAKQVAKPVYKYAAGLTTGSGGAAVDEALKGSDNFTQAMRGQTTETQVLQGAKDALQQIKNDRAAAYQTQLANLSKNIQEIPIDDVKSAADSWLARYRIKVTPDGLDFSRSTLRANPQAAGEVQAVYDAVKDWGSQAGDLTPVGLDTLKRTIADSYTSQNPSRAMVTALGNAVKTKITGAVPEYGKMTRDYAKASELIKDLEKSFSLTDQASKDTALRKLMTAFREDKTFRRSMLETLGKQGGADINSSVAGLLMKNPWTMRLGPIAHFYGTSAVAAYLHNPALLALLPAASPRLVGELSKLLGESDNAAATIRPLFSGAYQAGRLPLQQPVTAAQLPPPQ